MESAHAEVACMLIEAGADRERVGLWYPLHLPLCPLSTALVCASADYGLCLQTNLDGEMPEQLEGVGGQEQRKARQYVRERCGPPPEP